MNRAYPGRRRRAGWIVGTGLAGALAVVLASGAGRAGSAAPPEIPLLVAGERVTWDEIRPALAEASGGLVVEEVALDRLLAQEARRAGIRIGNAEMDAEAALFRETVAAGAGVGPDRALELERTLRAARGLGPERYRALLRRNATLRRLVADRVEITPGTIEQAYQMAFGERRRIRLIVTRTEQSASEARRRVAGDAGGGEPFGEVAARTSIDVSAQRGGLLDPFSLADPGYPMALRETLRGMTPGQVSPVIALDEGFAVARLEEVLPASGVPLEQVRAEVERGVRLREERIAMDRLAQELLGRGEVTVFDPSLRWAWESRPAR